MSEYSHWISSVDQKALIDLGKTNQKEVFLKQAVSVAGFVFDSSVCRSWGVLPSLRTVIVKSPS